MQDPALDRNIARLALGIAGHLDPCLVERRIGVAIRRHQPHFHAGEFFEPEIGASIEPQHVHMSIDLRDERQEQRPVQSPLVEIIGRDIGCHHHHGAEFEQF